MKLNFTDHFGAAKRSLFIQMFVVLLGTVALVQAINFALLLVMPTPAPRIDSVSRMASALASGSDGGGAYIVERWNRLPPGPLGERDLVLTRRFASAMNIPATRLRARINVGPPDVGIAFESIIDPASGLRGEPSVPDAVDTIYGPVIVALALPDGSWRSVRPVPSGLTPWQWRALGWLIGAVAVAILPAWWLARRLTRPMRLFAVATERLGRDPHAPPVPVSGPAELKEAATAFNAMQRQLNQYVADRMTMIAAVAHDLRTPLMRMSMRLPDASHELHQALGQDIEEMNQRLLAVMALVQDMSMPARLQKIDLRSIAQSVVDETVDRGADAQLRAGDRIVFEGDPTALKAMINNLVTNACLYGASADMAITDDAENIIIDINDCGPGMAAEDLERAFDPFFRGENSRNRDTGGMGLGLASVRAVAHAHGGKVSLIPRPGGGLTARVILPFKRLSLLK